MAVDVAKVFIDVATGIPSKVWPAKLVKISVAGISAFLRGKKRPKT